tara:strand:- start:269 stop:421 length:153 start_codon:yes stop_codon:yes gene_type:complete
MKPSVVLAEMKELRKAWRKESFKFTREQRARYDELLKLRRKRVSELLSKR